MQASLKKRAAPISANENEIEFLTNQMSHYDQHLDGARQVPEELLKL